MKAVRPCAAGIAVFLVCGLATPRGAESQSGAALDQGEREEALALVEIVDRLVRGEMGAPPPTGGAYRVDGAPVSLPGLELDWRNEFLKSVGQRIYVPFTVDVVQASMASSALAVYVRVVEVGASGGVPASQEGGSRATPAFEDVYFLSATAAGADALRRVSRAFAVPAGVYDVYVALRVRVEEGLPVPPAAVLKRSLTVPDFWDGALTTSSIIVADRVQPVEEALDADAQRERPYVVGSAELFPSATHRFSRSQDLFLFFQIYNPALDERRKPDVSVEYRFLRREDGSETFFNRMEPQVFDTRTLPPNFDADAGHQLSAGWSVPLSSFPEGDYRLEIEIADARAGRSIERDVTFTVVGS